MTQPVQEPKRRSGSPGATFLGAILIVMGIAALRARLGGLSGRRVAVVLTGRNVDGATLRSVLAEA